MAAQSLEEQLQLGARRRSSPSGSPTSSTTSTSGSARTPSPRPLETAPTYVVTGHPDAVPARLRPALLRGLRRPVREPRRRDRIRVVGQDAATRGRRYLLAAIGQSIVNGVVVGLTCWAVGLPAAVSLGFVVGVLHACCPLIGVLVGGVPALLLAFGLRRVDDRCIVLRGAARPAGGRGGGGAALRRRSHRARRTDDPDRRRPPRLRALRRRWGGLRHRPGRHRASPPSTRSGRSAREQAPA